MEAASTPTKETANKSPTYAFHLAGCDHNSYASHNFQVFTATMAAIAGLLARLIKAMGRCLVLHTRRVYGVL